jgi:hypothetical protein
MSFRTFLWLGWLAGAVAGCGGVLEADAISSSVPDAEQAPTAELVIDGNKSLEVVTRGESPLSVRLTNLHDGTPRKFTEVQFGLSGNSEGASLDAAAVLTDDDGVAKTRLRAGGMVSKFEVRVSAQGADPVRFEVSVGQAARPTLTLAVSYAGQRRLESRRIAVVSNMTCEQLRTNSAEAFRVSYVLGPNDQSIAYQEVLGAGSRYVAYAWGSDDTNSTLATGCREFTSLATDHAAEAALAITVPLEDLPFTLGPTYDVTMHLDLSRPLASLAARTSARVQAALPKTSTPEASFLLDGLATKLDFSAARASLGLDAALAARLSQAKAGPLRFFEALSGSVTEESMSSSLEGQLTPAFEGTPNRFEITRLASMRGGMSARELDLAMLQGKAAELAARYDDATAALVIDALSIPLGFGALALDLLGAVQSLPDAQGLTPAARNGCTQLKALVDENAAIFPGLSGTQAASVCASQMDALLTSVRSDWSSFDVGGAGLRLNGSVFVHDRDGDAVVDDLGPSPLTGTFVGSISSAETSVSATLRVTPVSALTI